MGITSLTEAQHVQELTEAAEIAIRLKKETFERHPNLAVDANWSLITSFIGHDHSPLNTANIERAIGILLGPPPRLAVLSDVERQARQQQMADTVCLSQFQKTFKPSERESWSAKLYAMARDKRHRYLVQLSRVELMDLVEREKTRPAILDAKKASRPAFNASVILGGKQAYEATLAAELEQYASMDIEELEKIGAELRAVDTYKSVSTEELRTEVHDEYLQRHPQAVGSAPVKSFAEAREYDRRATAADEPVITYSAQELRAMPIGEYRRYFMQQGSGGWTYRKGYEAAINKILNGEESEPARIRSEFLRTHVVR